MLIRCSKTSAYLALAVLSSSLSVAGEEPTVADNVKKSTKEAAQAVADAGEHVSERIQGETKARDGELVKGMRTNTGRGYGAAGCGLGSIIFDPGSGFTQVFAATTNGSFGTQTFGITSGTSNCAEPARGEGAARAFIETNRVALAKDIARGSGETLAGLAQLAGCAEAVRVGSHLQQRFAFIFPSAGRTDREVSLAVVEVLRTDTSLECTSLL